MFALSAPHLLRYIAAQNGHLEVVQWLAGQVFNLGGAKLEGWMRWRTSELGRVRGSVVRRRGAEVERGWGVILPRGRQVEG